MPQHFSVSVHHFLLSILSMLVHVETIKLNQRVRETAQKNQLTVRNDSNNGGIYVRRERYEHIIKATTKGAMLTQKPLKPWGSPVIQ